MVQYLVTSYNALIRAHDHIGFCHGWTETKVERECLLSIIDAIGDMIDELIAETA